MLGSLKIFEALFPRTPVQPAVAAAVTVLAHAAKQKPANPLDPALLAVAPHLSADERTAWLAALAGPLQRAGILTPHRIAAFLGQCAAESGGFRCLEEDLSYSAARLCQVWPNRFPTEDVAACFAMQPEILANHIYANRLGNGDEASGDGWRYRGRGLIQITGRSTYQRFAMAMNMSITDAVEHAATRQGAADSAVWFWSANQLNALADAWSIDLVTRKINGGMTGAAERTRLCSAALQSIGA